MKKIIAALLATIAFATHLQVAAVIRIILKTKLLHIVPQLPRIPKTKTLNQTIKTKSRVKPIL